MNPRVLWAVVFVAAGQAGVSSAQSDAARPAVVRLEGKVFQERGARSRELESVPVAIRVGDRVRTGKGKATIRFHDGSEVRLGEHASYSLEVNDEDAIAGSLASGKLWAAVTKMRRRLFEVRTAAAVASVRGTEFSVEVRGPKDTLTRVRSGVVAVRSLGVGGGEVLLRSGESVSVIGGVLGVPGKGQGAQAVPAGKPERSSEKKETAGREVELHIKKEASESMAASASANPMAQEGASMMRMANQQQDMAAKKGQKVGPGKMPGAHAAVDKIESAAFKTVTDVNSTLIKPILSDGSKPKPPLEGVKKEGANGTP